VSSPTNTRSDQDEIAVRGNQLPAVRQSGRIGAALGVSPASRRRRTLRS
jgi:hypothetical protein